MKIVIELPHDDGNDDDNYDDSDDGVSDRVISNQSVTSRLETSRYRDFLNFLRVSVSFLKILVSKKTLGIGLENIWSRKKSQYRSGKISV